jgi:hypothetical protein
MERFDRVTRREPCEICGKNSWCMVSKDRAVAICARVESPKRISDAGWLHRITDSPRRDYVRPVPIRTDTTTDWEAVSRKCEKSLESAVELASSLGVPTPALLSMHVGWSEEKRAYTFPMRDSTGKIIGIRTRAKDGKKLTITGGHNGIFIPDPLSEQGDQLLVCEGPTDCAAIYSLGFDVIGRPSNTGGKEFVLGVIKVRRPRRVILVLDRDKPGSDAERLTREGAAILASQIKCECRMILPPKKDARDWIKAGATCRDFARAIDNAHRL